MLLSLLWQISLMPQPPQLDPQEQEDLPCLCLRTLLITMAMIRMATNAATRVDARFMMFSPYLRAAALGEATTVPSYLFLRTSK